MKRAILIALRVSAIAILLAVLLLPVAQRPPSSTSQAVVPILVDVSGSMRIGDADGLTRVARAKAVAQFDLQPALSQKYDTPVIEVGDSSRSDLLGALTAARERFRGRRVAGVVLLSDGADTGTSRPRGGAEAALPVFAVGIGSAPGPADREIVGIAAGEQRLTDASVDLDVTASSEGFGKAPYEIRLLADDKPVDAKRVFPSADASPVHVRFTVSPDPAKETVYRAEIPAAGGELVTENNARTVRIAPPGRKRRLLLVAGAPGFEHSFMTRAWSADPGLDVDAVVRKGKNAEGRDTFAIQAAPDRAAALATGFPKTRDALYAYDALVLANADADVLAKPQLEMIADFVGDHGGGLLVAGSRALTQRELIGTPLEPVLPVELDSRRVAVARASTFVASGPGRTSPNQLVVTDDGATHPVMRLGASGDETRAKWAALPALAGSTPLGPARPGASVLAVASSAEGAVFPVVAVQKYGKGRSMIFGGEASWRWRMLSPATDRSHELFWRQAARWVSTSQPDSAGADETSIGEFANPRLNEPFLRRLARESGGRYVRAADAKRVLAWLDESAKQRSEPARREMWNQPWIFALVIVLLCAEWTLRRRWGRR